VDLGVGSSVRAGLARLPVVGELRPHAGAARGIRARVPESRRGAPPRGSAVGARLGPVAVLHELADGARHPPPDPARYSVSTRRSGRGRPVHRGSRVALTTPCARPGCNRVDLHDDADATDGVAWSTDPASRPSPLSYWA